MLALPVPTSKVMGQVRPFRSCKDSWAVQYNDRGVLTGDTLQRTLVIDYDASTWRTYLPEKDARLAEYPWLTFAGGVCNQHADNAALADVVLNYRQLATQDGEGGKAPGQELPADYTEWSPGSIRVDIRRHPKWNTPNPAWLDLSLADFWDEEKQAMLTDDSAVAAGVAGLTEYIVGSCMVTSHTFSWREPTDPSDLFGKRGVPPGFSRDGITNWLIVSGSVNPQSGFWHQTLVYQYSDNNASGPTSLWEWLYDAA